MASITFYEMPSCPHCVKAKADIASYNGPITFIIKNASEAPAGVRGFPHFVASNGKEVSGYGGSLSNLFSELGLQENYRTGNCNTYGTPMGGHSRSKSDWIGIL
jgi:arsenate reductase-like glutaredoxin family protein